MTIAWFMETLFLPLLTVTAILTFVSLARRRTLPNHVMAFSLLVTLGIGIAAAYAVIAGQTTFLDVGLILALVSFVCSVAFTHYLERRTTA